jgi:hypothetical protein
VSRYWIEIETRIPHCEVAIGRPGDENFTLQDNIP